MEPLQLLVNGCGGILIAYFLAQCVKFATATWRVKCTMARLRKLGKPMPPSHPIFGHLLEMKKTLDEVPPEAHSTYILTRVARKFGSRGTYYLDTWPVHIPLLTIGDPQMCSEVVYHPRVGSMKPQSLTDWFQPITGGPSLFTQNKDEWKHDHDIFLPFFNNANLDASMTVVMSQLALYRDLLLEKTKTGGLFLLEPLTLRLMSSIIGHLVFNAELNAQKEPHPLSDAMVQQLKCKEQAQNVYQNLIQMISPYHWYQKWDNGRRLDSEIGAQIYRRAEAYQKAKGHHEEEPFKSLLDQGLEDYFSQAGRLENGKIDPQFVKMLTSQMRMFYFAGYDSTASTMVYCCYTIWKHPEVLAKLRAEHDQVFGRNPAAASGIIAETPSILNSLPYTYAVIKETMRLFPAANAIREGSADLVLRDADGNEYPTDGCDVQINHYMAHRNPDVWPRPLEFLPERFLVEPGHELYPVKGAWRPFEYGVRNCTGQALVIKEIKAFLACIVREFDIQECYDEFDGDRKVDLEPVDFEKVYLVEAGAAHPRAKFPCRISLSGYH